jgi:MFS family permease
VKLRARTHTPLLEVARTLLASYPQRTLVGLSLMAAQAFFYNAIFFTYALILTDFYDVEPDQVGWYVLPFAAGNFLGPLVLGRLFDVLGRRLMISTTYALSGILLIGTGYLFAHDLLTAQTQTIAWMVVFFVASAAASSAYLTVSETFPLEIRALAIAVFYAIGTGIGGVVGPWLLGAIIETGSRSAVALGYLLGSSLMIVAALIGRVWGTQLSASRSKRFARLWASSNTARAPAHLYHLDRVNHGNRGTFARSQSSRMRIAARCRRHPARPCAHPARGLGPAIAAARCDPAVRADRRGRRIRERALRR